MKKKDNYLPALDGLRALSILIVLVAHLGFDNIIPGGFGVSVFFYVSGFLITNLLLQEYKKTGTINFKNFFIRRFLRLYPPILLMVVLMFVVPPLNKNIPYRELFACLFYYENYFYIFNYHISPNPTRLRPFWSLSIEEHFYLFFPFIFFFLIKFPKKLIYVLIALAAFALINRIYIAWYYQLSSFSDVYTYSATTCRIDSILLGCLSSIIIKFDSKKLYLKFSSNVFVFSVSIIVLLISLLYRDELFRQTFRYTLQTVSFMFIIPSIIYSKRYSLINRILSLPPLVFIGRLSYSLYIFHSSAYALVNAYITDQEKSLLHIVSGLSLAFLLAVISYTLVEKPVMKLRRKYGSAVGKNADAENTNTLKSSLIAKEN